MCCADGATSAEFQALMSEYNLLKDVNHPNVIKLIGESSLLNNLPKRSILVFSSATLITIDNCLPRLMKHFEVDTKGVINRTALVAPVQ